MFPNFLSVLPKEVKKLAQLLLMFDSKVIVHVTEGNIVIEHEMPLQKHLFEFK